MRQRQIRRWLSCALCCWVLLALPLPAASQPASRPYVDRRVDALSDATLQKLAPAALVDPLRAEVAGRVALFRRPLFFAWAFAQILFSFWLWRSGLAAHIRDRIQRRIRWRMVMRAAYITVMAVLNAVIAFPFDAIVYRKCVDLGISHQLPSSWLGDYAMATSIEVLVIVVCILCVLECVDRTRLWYVWSAAIVVVGSGCILMISPLFIMPLFHPTTPLNPQSTLGHRLYTIEERAGVGHIPIFIMALSRTTEVGNASVAGIGPARRVFIGDTLLRTATPREVAFVMAHELGHEVHHDPMRLTLLSDLLLILGAALAILIADRIPMRRDDDGVSRLPLVAALFGICSLALFPIGNAYSRHIESMADSFGLKISRDGTAGARVFVRFADEGFSPLCPPLVVLLYFYDHPPLGSRIARLTHRPDPCP